MNYEKIYYVDESDADTRIDRYLADYETEHSTQTAEQIIRPTGLLDAKIEVRPTKGQVDDLIGEIYKRSEAGERVLITTLTKSMAEDLTEYLENRKIKVRYIHFNIDTIERMEIIRDLRLGVFDVLVGINLLREGLDLPEVSLVAILDADKQGFLRSTTSLIQTIGRASRNAEGKVIMYADEISDSMRVAIDETERRRKKQDSYNQEHGIIPKTIVKPVYDIIDMGADKDNALSKAEKKKQQAKKDKKLSAEEKKQLKEKLTAEMKQAAAVLDFERAIRLRDRIKEL